MLNARVVVRAKRRLLRGAERVVRAGRAMRAVRAVHKQRVAKP
jgi:hypothetical protein